MGQTKLSSKFVKTYGNDELNETLVNLAKALNVLPANMAEDMIFLSLCTYTVGGKAVETDKLLPSLSELCRIRRKKGDGFMSDESWCHLEETPEYKAMTECVTQELNRRLVLHTISDYLKHHDDEEVSQMVSGMEELKEDVRNLVAQRQFFQADVRECFFTELMHMQVEGWQSEYLLDCAWEKYEFVIVFADLFIRMATPTEEVKVEEVE